MYNDMNDFPVSLADVYNGHNEHCICEECTDKIEDETGAQHLFIVKRGGDTKYYFHIDDLHKELKKKKYYLLYNEPSCEVWYSSEHKTADVTITRVPAEDLK